MIKKFFEKVDYFWFFLFITIILCFGFLLTNPAMGIDDEIVEKFISYPTILRLNRLGKAVLTLFFQYEFVPIVYDLLCIVTYTIALIINVDLFKKCFKDFSKKQSLIYTLMSISFPFLAFIFIFMVYCVDVGFTFLFASLSSYYFHKYFYEQKNKRYIIYSILLLMFSTSIYELALLYFILVSLFIVLYSFMFENPTIKLKLKQLLSMIAVLFSSIILYRILLFILQSLSNAVYNRADIYKMYDFSSLRSFIDSFIHCVGILVDQFLFNLNNCFASKITLVLCTCLLIISLIFSLIKKNIFILLIAILMVLTPLSYFIATGFFDMPYRVFVNFGFVNAMTCVILYKILSFNENVLKVLLFSVFITVFLQAKEMNNIFYAEYLKYQDDKLFAHSIDYDLKRLDLEGKPLVFVGLKECIITPRRYTIMANEIDISTFNWDRYDSFETELFVARPYDFMKKLGYRIDSFFGNNENIKEPIENYISKIATVTKEMSIYPRENSIKDMGDYVVIKIGKSKADD